MSLPWKYICLQRKKCQSGWISSACFNLEIRARSATLSLTSQTGTEVNGKWGAFSPSISPQWKCHANVRPWDAQSCRPKGRYPFTPSRKIAVEGSFILGDSNWKFFQVGYPVDTHTDMNVLLKVSVMHRPAFARLILGMVDRRNDLFGWNFHPSQFYKEYIQTNQRTQKYILTPWHQIKTKKGEKPPSQETLQKKKGKSTKETNVHTNPQQEWTRNKCKRRKERKKTKTKTNGHGKHGEKKGKTGGTTTELPTNTPALSKKQNKCEAKNQWKQLREK